MARLWRKSPPVMKYTNTLIKAVATISASAGLFFLASCKVDQTEEGSMPSVDVDVEEGNLPEYDVTGPDVAVGTKTKTIEVEVPAVDVDVPTDENPNPNAQIGTE